MTQLEVIWKFMASLSDANSSDNKTMLDAAIRACSNYDGIEDAIAEFLAAAKAAKDSTTFLAECGINVSNSDTGGITGSDAGGSVTKTSDTTVWEIANTYTANASATAAQNIFTGDNGWHVSATAFNDTIYSGGEDSISAGAGNDFISLNGTNSVILTGGDKDTISVGGAVNYFTVKDFTAGKTTILGANNFSSVVTANSDGTSTVKFTRNGSANSAATLSTANVTVDLSKVNTLSGNFDSSGNFTANSTLSSGNFLGNVTSDFDPSFLDVDSDGNLSFTYRGLKLNIIGQRDPSTKVVTTAINSSNIDSLKGDWRYVIIAGLYKWWLKEALDLNAEATGLGFTDGTATVAEMDLYFENYTSQSWLAYVSSSYYTETGKTAKLSLVINQRYFGSVSNENDPNCVVSGGTLDRTIAHEFNHAVFAANVNYFAKLPIFIKEGMAELIHGVDDKRWSSMYTLLRNTVNDNSNSWLEDYVRLDILNSSQVSTLKGGSGGAAYPYAAGYMFLRWLAKNSSDDATILADEKLSARVELRTDGVYYISGTRHLEETAQIVSFNGEYTGVSVGTVSGNTYSLNSAIKQLVTYFNTKSAWNISGLGDNVTIVADDSATGNDTISGGGTGVLIQSGAGNDSISVANFSDGTIYGGSGADTIRIGSSVSSLTFADFDAADVLDLASSVSSARFTSSTKTLTLGSATIILPNVGSSLYSFREMVVQNGGAKTTLGDLLGYGDSDIYFEWEISGSTATCKFNGAAVFTLTVSSFASGVTAYTLEDILQVEENSSGGYSVSFVSGKGVSDLIGAGTATLNGAAWNLTSAPSSTIAAGWNISGTSATYKTAEVIAGYVVSSDAKKITYTAASGGESLVTVTGVKNTAGLSLSGKVVTISASALNQTTVTVSDGYTLKLGSDVTKSTAAAASWNLNGTTATYISAATAAGYVLADDGKSITYNTDSGGGALVTVTGVKNTAGLSLSDKVVTVSASALNQGTVTISSGYSLNLAADVTISTTTAAGFNISGTTATYKTTKVTAGYVLANNQITYNAASGGDTLFTVSGLKNNSSADALSLSGTVVTISDGALNQGTVTISDGYTLRLGSGVTTPKTTAAGWNIDGTTATYGAAGTTAGYVLSSDGKTVTYNPATRETLATLYGVKSGAAASGFSMKGSVITLAASVLGASSVYIYGDYTLALGRNIAAPVVTAGGWSVENGKATYVTDTTTEGYTLSSDGKSVEYTAAGGGDILLTISGLSSSVTAEDIYMVRKVVTLTAGMVDGGTVTISDGYSLRLGSSVAKPETTAAHWEVSSGTANYFDTAVSAGYILSDDARTASYQAASGGEILVTVTGLKSNAAASSISLSGTEITLKAAALAQNTVSVSSGYSLKLADNVTLSAATAAHWEISGGTAKYIDTAFSAGYVLSDDATAVSYISASGGATLVTVSGLKNTATATAISLDGKTVTVSAAALNQGTVTITDSYTLKLASDVTLSETTAAHWELASGTAKYVSEKISAGYVLANNQITYNTASGGATEITVTGVKNIDGLSLSDKTVTVSAAALNQSAVKISSGYTLKLASDVELSETTAAHWELASGTAKYIGEKISAGYVLANNQITYNTASGGATEITVTGVKNIDGLNLSDKTVTVSAAALNQSAVKISSGYTLKLAADVTLSETTAAHWELASGTAKYIGEKISAGYVLANNQITYNTASGGETEITVSGVKNIDGLNLSDKTVTVSAAALNQSAVKISSGYTLKLASDVTLSETTAAHWELVSGTAKYVSEKISAGYVLANNQITYNTASGGATEITVTGVKNIDGLNLSDKTVTVLASALNQSAVTISSGYTLKLADDVTLSETTAAHWELASGTAKYIGEKISAGYVLANNQITYNTASGGATEITVTGVKNIDGLNLSDKAVTVSASALNQSAVTISSGYTLKLASDVELSETTAAHWELASGTAKYLSEKISAGYVLENNAVSYKSASGGETEITITGLKNTATAADISLDGKTVTISAAALNKSTVKVSAGYKLQLSNDVTLSETTAEHWEISGNTAKYISETTSAGYVLENSATEINYFEESGEEILATITGLKEGFTLDDLQINGTEIILTAEVLDGGTVTVTGGYTLKLADDVTVPETTAAHWEIASGTANYIAESTSAGYVVSSDATSVTYENSSGGENLVTITGLSNSATDSDISLEGTTVTISAAALNQTAVTIFDGYTLKLADDITTPETTAAHWEISSGTANYIAETTSAGYVLENNQITYVEGSGGEIEITISGIKSLDGISLEGTTVTISAAALNQTAVTISDGYTLKLADDVTTPETTAAHWEISDSTANYIAETTSAGYVLENNQISYVEETGGETEITVSGVKSLDGISLDDTTVTISAAALNQSTVTISDGYTIALASDVEISETTAAYWQISNGTANYISESNSAGYVLTDNEITYVEAGGGENLVTISGLNPSATAEDISLDGTTVTISAAALNQSTVTISNGYTLALASDVETSETTAAYWQISNGTANYISESNSAGYVLTDNEITYVEASGGENLITISGLSSSATASGINLSGTEVTLSAATLGTNTVSVSSGYTLELASDVTISSTTAAHWEVASGTARYFTEYTSAGYVLDNNQISYVSASGSTSPLITITGLNSKTTASDLSLDGTEITLSAAALGQNTVNLSTSGYTLKFADNVKTPVRTEAHWEISGTTAIYRAASTTAGYVLSNGNRNVNYTAASGGAQVTSVRGIKSGSSTDGLSLSGTTVTVDATLLNQKTVTVTNNHTLALASNVTTPSTIAAAWEISGTTATYKSEITTAGYSLASDKKSITYAAQTGGNSLVTVSGIKSGAPASAFSLDGNEVILKSTAVGSGAISISSGYKLTLASGNYSRVTLKGGSGADTLSNSGTGVAIQSGGGADVITNSGSEVTIDAGAGNDKITNSASKVSINGGAGNDAITLTGNSSNVTVTGGIGNDTVYGDSGKHLFRYGTGDGNDVYYGFNENDTLQITSGTVSSASVKGSDVVFTVNKSTVTLKDTAGKKVTMIDASGDASAYIYSDTMIFDANKTSVTLASSFKGTLNSYPASVLKIDGSNVTSAMKIAGNAKANTITGGTKSDSITGGTGNDILYGGAGVDTLVGGTGDDTLYGGAGGDVFVYALGDGADVIADYAAGVDKIRVTSGIVSSIALNNSDVVLKVGPTTVQSAATGSITVKNAKDKALTIINAQNQTISQIYSEDMIFDAAKTSVTLGSGFSGTLGTSDYYGSVKNIDAAIVTRSIGIVGNSQANTITSGSKAATIWGGAANDVIYGGAGADILYGEEGADKLYGGAGADTLYGGVGADTLYGGAGNDVFIYAAGEGNDIITDYTPDQDSIKISSGTITSASLRSSDVIFTVGKNTLNVKNGKDKKITVTDSNGKTSTQIFSSNYISTADQTAITLNANFNGTFNNYPTSVLEIDGSLVTTALKITGNAKPNTITGSAQSDSISGNAGNDLIYGGAGKDTLIGGKGNDTLYGGSGADIFMYAAGEGSDVIADFSSSEDKIKITSGSVSSVSVKGGDVTMNIGSGSIKILDAADKKISVVNANNKTTTQIYSAGMTFDENKTSVTLASNFSGTLNSTDYAATVAEIYAGNIANGLKIFGNARANTITGTAKADNILGGAGADILYGGVGNDTLEGGAGNDTLYGGRGSDVFVYSSGDGADIIADFTEGEDKIRLTSGSLSGGSVSGSDVVLTVDKGSIKILDGADKKITVVDANKKSVTQIYSAGMTFDEDKTAVTLAANFSGTLNSGDYASTVKKIDASQVTSAVKIFGNDKANTITGSGRADYLDGGSGNDALTGGGGNDSLYGGAGNDTLTGGAGSDIFMYGEGGGADVITDYTAGADKIKITSGTVSSASVKGSNVVFKVGSGSLTVNNGKGKQISVLDASNKITTYNFASGVSGSSAMLFVDDNFIGGATIDDISEISATSYSVGKIRANDFENLAAADKISLAAYSSKN